MKPVSSFLQLATTCPDLPSDFSEFLQDGPNLLLHRPQRGDSFVSWISASLQNTAVQPWGGSQGNTGSQVIIPHHSCMLPSVPSIPQSRTKVLRQRDLSQSPPHLVKYQVCEVWRELLAPGFAHGAELGPCCS